MTLANQLYFISNNRAIAIYMMFNISFDYNREDNEHIIIIDFEGLAPEARELLEAMQDQFFDIWMATTQEPDFSSASDE